LPAPRNAPYSGGTPSLVGIVGGVRERSAV
jgi:hypothetical protein